MEEILHHNGISKVNFRYDAICQSMSEYAALAVKEKEERIKELEEGLSKIAYPIKWMQNNLQEGEKLNGHYAIELADNARYLSDIAKSLLPSPPKQ